MDEERQLERMARLKSTRLHAMIVLLFENVARIDELKAGSVEFHCSGRRVVLKLNGAVAERVVED